MRALVAVDDTGGLKEISFPSGTDTSVQTAPQPTSIDNHAEQGRRKRIEFLRVFEMPDEQKTEVVAVARKNEAVELYRLEDYELLHAWPVSEGTTSQIVGFELVSDKLITANESGMVVVRDLANTDKTLSVSLNKNQLAVFRACEFRPGVFAFGGKDRDIEIVEIDLENGELKSLFKGKNVKNDKLDLQVPIHITDIKFLSADKKETFELLTSTKYGQIRVYDTSKGRRPVQDIKVTRDGIKLLAPSASDKDVIYADTHMNAAIFDISRKQKKGNFDGFTGNTQSLHSYEGRLLAAGGLDRYLRVFDLQTREPVGKIFTGCEISAVHILEDDVKKREVEADELWDELETAAKPKAKKQKKTHE